MSPSEGELNAAKTKKQFFITSFLKCVKEFSVCQFQSVRLLDLAEVVLMSSLFLLSLSGEGRLLVDRAADRKSIVARRASVCNIKSREENTT